MRHAIVISLVSSVFATAQEKIPVTPEVKWTKRIVDDFLEAVFRGSNAGFGLLSPELSKSYRNIQHLYGEFSDYESHTFLNHEVAPDKTEVIHKLVLKGSADPAEVTIRVARESQGRWSIRYIRIRPIPKKE